MHRSFRNRRTAFCIDRCGGAPLQQFAFALVGCKRGRDLERGARFRKAAELTPQTFNSFYADDKHIGFFTTGKLPLRKSGSSGDLPIDGRGSYEWTGFLKNSAHPQAKDPKSGLIVNWNNVSAGMDLVAAIADFPEAAVRL